MFKRCGRKDNNQNEIVTTFEHLGVSILDTSRAGYGVPDLIAGYRGVNHLVEVKNPENNYGRRGLNPLQSKWAEHWPTPVYIVRTIDDVTALVRAWAVAETTEEIRKIIEAHQ